MIGGGLWIDDPLLVLVLTALAAPLTIVGWRVFRLGMSGLRVWSSLLLRTLLMAALALTLAGTSAVRETDRMAVVVLVDGSDSMLRFALPELAAQLRERSEASADDGGDTAPVPFEAGDLTAPVRAFLRAVSGAREPDDLFGLVVFGERPVAVVAPTAREGVDTTVDHADAEASDLAAAIRYADLIVPAGVSKRLVLISDGGETSGDALAEARALAARAGAAVPIDVVPVAYRVSGEVMVEALDLPPQASRGDTIAVRAVLNATDLASGVVELTYNGAIVDVNGEAAGTGRRVRLVPGRNVVTLQVPLAEAPVFHRMEVTFRADADEAGPIGDTVAANNRAEAFTVTRGSGVALVLDGREATEGSGAPNALAAALEAAGLRVERRSPAAAPTDLLELQGYDLVVMQDVGVWEMPQRARDRLVDHVSLMGGGLVMVGGEDGFGAGRWLDSEIADILPVRLDIPDELIISQAAVAIVLDSSGSMARSVFGSTRSQQTIANAGAAEAVRSLDTTDMLMVVEFSSSPRVVVPMGPNTGRERNARRVEAITSGGGTRILDAMRVAGEELVNVEANVKHMIVLTDGRDESTRGGDAGGGMVAYADRLADAGVTVTTIGIGDAEEEALRQIAVAGEGVFYKVDDPRTLPAIFLQEVSVVRRPLIRETPFTPQIADAASPLVLGVAGFSPGDTPPDLTGLVLTRTREDPKISYPLITDDGHPVLAHWSVGRGQVAAFTSDASAAGWAGRWVAAAATGEWPGYAALWAQIARVIARSPIEAGVDLSTEVVGDELRITYDASDDAGVPRDGLVIGGTVSGPIGEAIPIRLTQTGPGRYQARVPAAARGNYVVALTPADAPVAGKAVGLVLGGATKATGPEQRRLYSDVSLLHEIADVTGGRVLGLDPVSARTVYDRTGIEPARAVTPLWPLLTVFALTLLVADIATRRVAWDRMFTREVVDDVKRHTQEAVVARAEAVAGTVGGLRERFAKPLNAEQSDRPRTPPRAAVTAGRSAAVARTSEASKHDDDQAAERARRILERQSKKRDDLRAEALEALSGGGGGHTTSSAKPSKGHRPAEAPKTKEKTPQDDAGVAPTEGLLAAKRRAAERRKGRDV